MIKPLLAFALILSFVAPASAQVPTRIKGLISKRIATGISYNSDGLLQQRGTAWCRDGRFVDASVLPERREIRLVCAKYQSDPESRVYAEVLDADAKVTATVPIRSSGTTDATYDHVAWIERGRSDPIPVTWDHYRARVWDKKGNPVDLTVTDGVSDIATISDKNGGPLLVIAHQWGENGLEAFRQDGTRAWAASVPYEVRRLESTSLDGKPLLAAWHSVGRLTFVDARGKVREQTLPGGNSDRLLLEDGKTPRMLVLDNGAGSKREALSVFEARKGKDGRTWEKTETRDLGPVTITGWTLVRLAKSEAPRTAVGTSNGWVFLFDEKGATLDSVKFLSPVRRLQSADLDGDGAEELVAILDGGSQSVVVFSAKKP